MSSIQRKRKERSSSSLKRHSSSSSSSSSSSITSSSSSSQPPAAKKTRKMKRNAPAKVTPFPTTEEEEASAANESKEESEDQISHNHIQNNSDDSNFEVEFSEEDRIFLNKKPERNKKEKKEDDDGRGVVYIGRIPHGFYEDQMKKFFEQFGEITRLRISRNKKTGKSKHYGFIEFRHKKVAQIAADTMNGRLMFNHILRVKFMEKNQMHPELFKGANQEFKVISHKKKQIKLQNRKRGSSEHDKLAKQLKRNDNKRKKKLEELGIEYDFPGYSSTLPEKPKRTKFSSDENS